MGKYLNSWCHSCINIYLKEHRKKFPWKETFQHIKTRCESQKCKDFKDYGMRGIKCLITEDEIKFLYERDNARLMKQPSINRKNNNGNYTVDNCEFIEWGKNSAERNVRVLSKIVFQFDKNMNFIKEWNSTRDVERALFLDCASISRCCLGKQKTCGKFIWKYKND